MSRATSAAVLVSVVIGTLGFACNSSSPESVGMQGTGGVTTAGSTAATGVGGVAGTGGKPGTATTVTNAVAASVGAATSAASAGQTTTVATVANASSADAASTGSQTSGGGGTDAGSAADVVITFHNGVFWNDVAGNRIEAHGGGFIKVGDTWYWIGEDKSQGSTFKAVNCYASKDLSNWEFQNAIITPKTTATLATAGRIIERPKLIYNDTTQLYVMWLHWDGNSYADAEAGVFTSATVCGNYAYHGDFRPNSNMARDDSLFKDDDGKAYFMAAANNNADMIVYQLSDDYLTIGKQVITLFAGSSREAPAMFKQGGQYFLITSAATGWDPNQQKYASAPAIGGPWTGLKNIGDATAFDSQAAYVIPVVGSKTTTYIYAGDRWQDPDLPSSKYIWLPLTINGTTVTMDNHDDWQLDVTTGQWSVNDGFVPQAGWSLLYADSEETQAEDGHGKNAFDGSSSTLWHTQYTGSAPPHPHELQIDLGATYAVAGMRYLPRQDKDDHGMVADYQFYVSQDSTNWGTPVATGTFTSTRSATTVPFAATSARFIRFVALSEINAQPWASIAELDLVPAP